MKVWDIPKSGRAGLTVAYRGRFGNCHRMWVSPHKTITPARRHMWGEFGRLAPAWSRVLTQAQRDGWNVAGPKVQSKRRSQIHA